MLRLQDLGFDLNKREFRDAVKLRYDWPVEDIPSTCACGEAFTVAHSMICKLGGFITQRHNELRDLEAEFLSMVCSDVEIEPVLQDISGEHLNRGSNKAQDARLYIHARGFWERHRSAFFDVRVCHPNTVSYRDLEPQQIYRLHENEKKRLYSKRVLDIEHGTFTPLVFTTTGGMGKECLKYHSRLAQLIAIKKGEQYAKTISWIRTRTSFALLRFVFEAIGQEECHVTLRMLISTSKLLKEPLNRIIDVFPYFIYIFLFHYHYYYYYYYFIFFLAGLLGR